MPCPVCGSGQRSPLAPGLWQCLGQRLVRSAGPGAYGQPGPPEVSQWVACATQYQEGDAASSGPLCSCGTFAVGVCQTCGQPVCGYCSSMVSGVRECNAHVAERAAREAEEREQERKASVARGRARYEQMQPAKDPEVSRAELLKVHIPAVLAAGVPTVAIDAAGLSDGNRFKRTDGWIVVERERWEPGGITFSDSHRDGSFTNSPPRTLTERFGVTTGGQVLQIYDQQAGGLRRKSAWRGREDTRPEILDLVVAGLRRLAAS